MVNEAVTGMSLFCQQFGKMDIYTTIVLEELFKELLQHHESIPVPSEERSQGIQSTQHLQLGESSCPFEAEEHYRLEFTEEPGIPDTTEHLEG
jgi:hypothetical protein